MGRKREDAKWLSCASLRHPARRRLRGVRMPRQVELNGDMDNYLVIMTVDNDVDYAVYVRASDCESAFVEAAKLYPRSDVQPRVAQLLPKNRDEVC